MAMPPYRATLCSNAVIERFEQSSPIYYRSPADATRFRTVFTLHSKLSATAFVEMDLAAHLRIPCGAEGWRQRLGER
jgi:hypothetical protein